MLLAAQGLPVLAETVSNDTIESVGRDMPKNPVHHCTKKDNGTDTTDWSYVYFGSYPQTEVTGDALTEAITGASYDSSGDAWVGSTKYRRISKSDTNYDGYFGASEYRYFKWERIKWRVLENNGSTLFVVADKGLDCKDYHDPGSSITWENCTLRSWLNSEFYGTAFSSSEQGAIVRQNVVNEDNPEWGTEGGNDTSDNVFLLSIGEVTNPAYGFCEDYSTGYSTNSASRWMQTSDYAHARGAYTYSDNNTGGNANCWWWLRSPGTYTDYAAYVYDNGDVDRYGYYVNYAYRACVPALHINLSSDLWSTADDGSSGEGGNGGTKDDRISSFRIDSSASGTIDAPVTLSGFLELSDQAETSSSILQQEIDAITWISSDASIVQEEELSCSAVNSYDNRSASLLVSFTPRRTGTVTITGKTSNGLTSSCEVVISDSSEKEETVLKHVTGILESVDLNNLTVTIGSIEYQVTDSFNISDAYSILIGNGCKTVAAVLANDRISHMDAVTALVEPKASLAVKPVSVSYQDGAFDHTKLAAVLTLSCSAKSPYRDSDLKGTEAENVAVSFSGYTLKTGKGLHFRTSLISNSTEYTDKNSFSLKFGQEKELEQIIYIDDAYVPQEVKEILSVTASASAGSASLDAQAKVNVANMDKQAEIAEDKTADGLVEDAEQLMDKINFSLSEDAMQSAGYTKSQKESIQAAVKIWIANILATEVMTQDTGDDSIWAEFCKEAGFSDSEKQKFITDIAKKAFKKLGLDISSIIGSGSYIQWNNMEADTEVRVYQNDNKTYDTIAFTLTFGNLSFTDSQAFTGFGDIDFTIKTAAGKTYDGIGMVTFADLEKFAADVEKICKKEIKNIYKLDIGSNIDKGTKWLRKQLNGSTKSKIVEKLTSDTANKLIQKKLGSFSDNVFKIYYNKLSKSTMGCVFCPVDVYIFDSQGNLCGSIVDNQVDTDTGEIFLYCEGDQKFFRLTGDDYTVKLKGNGEGTMTYRVEEYLGTEVLRTISYEEVPLNDGKAYTGMIPGTQMLDGEVYHLVAQENAEMVLPASDTKPSNEGSGSGNDTENPGTGENKPGSGGEKPGAGTGENKPDTGTDQPGSGQTPGTGTGTGQKPNTGTGSGTGTGTVPAVSKISIQSPSKKIAAGKKVSLSIAVSPKGAAKPKVTWTSSNKKYAAVNSKGVVTTKKAGKGKTVAITAAASDGRKAIIKLKIMKHAVTKVQIKNTSRQLKAGKTLTLKATVKANGRNANKTLKWTTSNKAWATVTAKGKVTAKKAGKGKTVTITAASTDGTNKKARVKIKIK